MRLSLVKSKNATQFYVIKSFRDSNGKNTSKIIEKLGNLEEVTKKANGQDPIEWAKEYIKILNEKEKNESLDIIAKFSPSTQIPKDIQNMQELLSLLQNFLLLKLLNLFLNNLIRQKKSSIPR